MAARRQKWLYAFAFLLSAAQVEADIMLLGPSQQSKPSVPSLEDARRLVKAGKVPEARVFLRRKFVALPNQPHPDILLAQLLGEVGRGPEARQVLESLALAEPNRLDVCVVFCDLAVRESRWFDAWVHALAAGKAQPPKNWTGEHLKVVQRDVQVLKAACCEGRGDFEGAIEIYSHLAEQKKQTADVLTALGRCQFHLGNIEDALRHFDGAFKADAERDVAELAVATLFDSTGSLEEAEKHFLKAVLHEDRFGRSRAKLSFARWLIWNNQAERIEQVLSEEFEAPEMDQDRRLLLGMAARMQQQYAVALELFSELHQENSHAFPISNQLALVLIECEDESLRSRALQIAEANVRNNPGFAEAWSTLGWIQFRLGDLASARQNLDKGTSGGVLSRDTAWQLAQIHKQLGNVKEAAEFLSAANSSKGPFFAMAAADSQ